MFPIDCRYQSQRIGQRRMLEQLVASAETLRPGSLRRRRCSARPRRNDCATMTRTPTRDQAQSAAVAAASVPANSQTNRSRLRSGNRCQAGSGLHSTARTGMGSPGRCSSGFESMRSLLSHLPQLRHARLSGGASLLQLVRFRLPLCSRTRLADFSRPSPCLSCAAPGRCAAAAFSQGVLRCR